jgi:CRP-like cAMP-binding protein
MTTPLIPGPDSLANMELFVGLPPEGLAEVAKRARAQALPKGAILFTQGMTAERCHALVSGRIRIAQSGEEGGQLLVRFVGPGEMFGTVALFTDRRYPAEASTVTDSIEISWTEPVLLELIESYPQIALNLIKVIGTRLREVQERLRELATQRVDQRMARVLLRLASRHPVDDDDRAEIEFPVTREDIAAMCGATLYTASRVLTAWERAGYVKTHRRRLSILRIDEIRRLATVSN